MCAPSIKKNYMLQVISNDFHSKLQDDFDFSKIPSINYNIHGSVPATFILFSGHIFLPQTFLYVFRLPGLHTT